MPVLVQSVMLSVKEICEPVPNVLVPPGLYRGTRKGPDDAPEYQLRLSTILVERDIDVTVFVQRGTVIPHH